MSCAGANLVHCPGYADDARPIHALSNDHDVIMIITIIMMTMIKVLIPAWSRLTEADSAMGWISVQQVWTLVAYIRFFVPYYFFI